MPPLPILDPADIDWNRLVYTREQIYQVLPQRHEFAQVDGVVFVDKNRGIMAGFRDVRADEWWCRGHLPQRAIFPGILMMECAAQLAAFYNYEVLGTADFMGFGGVDEAKFRGAVFPPARIHLIGKCIEARPRRFVSAVQAYVDRVMVFEGTVTGMPVRF